MSGRIIILALAHVVALALQSQATHLADEQLAAAAAGAIGAFAANLGPYAEPLMPSKLLLILEVRSMKMVMMMVTMVMCYRPLETRKATLYAG